MFYLALHINILNAGANAKTFHMDFDYVCITYIQIFAEISEIHCS